jgi:hypothetical protein
MNQDASRSDEVLFSFSEFVFEGSGIRLYDYQLQPARAILDSIRLGLGLTIILDFPIKSGKDELLSQLEIYLMRMLNDKNPRIVIVNPRDSKNLAAVMRLEDRLRTNIFSTFYWEMERMGFVLGSARTYFYSLEAMFSEQIILANLLLVVNDAGLVKPSDYDEFNQLLTAGRKITRVICGSPKKEGNLLEREKGRAFQDEEVDGIRRLFEVTEEQATRENKNLEFTLANLGDFESGWREVRLRERF